jgi:hypothetical protein
MKCDSVVNALSGLVHRRVVNLRKACDVYVDEI